MADNTALTTEVRYLYGETSPVDATVDTATELKIGDIVLLTAGKVVAASSVATAALAAASFMGISGQTKLAGADQIRGNSRKNRVRIDTTGTFSIPCADALVVGDKVGPKVVGGKATTQEVTKAAAATDAIGICVADKAAGDTHAIVQINSKLINTAPLA
jgi:hypothetical protein